MGEPPSERTDRGRGDLAEHAHDLIADLEGHVVAETIERQGDRREEDDPADAGQDDHEQHPHDAVVEGLVVHGYSVMGRATVVGGATVVVVWETVGSVVLLVTTMVLLVVFVMAVVLVGCGV
jgi:hypothetical protein